MAFKYRRFRLLHCLVTVRRRCRRDRRLFAVSHFRLRQRSLTTDNMEATSDRNPPPFPATEEPGAGRTNMADGDIDEGEDIFVNNVCSQSISMFFERFAIICPHRDTGNCAALSDQTGCHCIQNNWHGQEISFKSKESES